MKYNPYLIAFEENIIGIGRVDIRVVSSGLVLLLRVPRSVAQLLGTTFSKI